MERSLKSLFLYIIILASFSTSTQAAVIVYTDRATWETEAFNILHPSLRYSEDFESVATGALSTGQNVISSSLGIDISGDPGFNSIDDSLTTDPFSDALSPNGSRYYLGQTGVSGSPTLVPWDGPLGAAVEAFAADWVTFGDIDISIGSTVISLNDYLPSGSGFLGLYVEAPRRGVALNSLPLLTGDEAAYFGMDDVRYTARFPIPSAVWLFGSGLLGLVGIARRKKA